MSGKAWNLSFILFLFLANLQPAEGQQSGEFVWNKDHVVPAGSYTFEGKVCLIGGEMIQDGVLVNRFANPVPATLSPGTRLSGVHLLINNAKLTAHRVFFSDCTIELGPDAQLELKSCAFQGGEIKTYSATSLDAENPGVQGSIRSGLMSSVSLEDCVLNETKLRLSLFRIGMRLSIAQILCRNCHWHRGAFAVASSFGMASPFGGPRGSAVENCVFTNCVIRANWLAMTDGCGFVDCQWDAGPERKAPLPPVGSKPPPPKPSFPLSAAIKPADGLPKAMALSGFSEFRITPPPMQPTGCGLGYSIIDQAEAQKTSTKAGLTVSGLGAPNASAPMVSLATVLPATLVSSRPGMPALPAPASAPVSGTPVAGTRGAPDCGLKSQQASIHGLLINSLERGDAGSASRLSAIALGTDKTVPSEVSFNQTVGDMMSTALIEVGKFTQLRHKGWPTGYKIELSFADKYSDKDGPSAAVACALLLNSMITGKENDPAFAVTGDMNADGSVQPIGGVAAKIRGATNGKCKIVAIPAKNETSLGDLLLTDGPGPFAGIQIYSVSSFDEAEALALKDKPAATQNAVELMARVQEVLMRDRTQIGAWLRNQHVQTKLQEALQAAPNNLSAKYLLMYAAGRVPQSLSLAGSLGAVENAAADLISSIKTSNGQNHDGLRRDVVGSSITRLQNLRAKCDPRVRPYADTLVRFGSAVKESQDRPANSSARANVLISAIKSAANAAQSESQRLMSDPQVREELEQ